MIPTQDVVKKGSETMIAKKSSKASDALSEACGATDGAQDQQLKQNGENSESTLVNNKNGGP